MSAQFYLVLVTALVTILDAADSFIINSNLTQSLMGEVTHEVPVGGNFVKESAAVNIGPPSIWAGNVPYQWKVTDQNQASGNSPNQQGQVGFFDAIRSLTNVFTGLVGRVSTPTIEQQTQPPMETFSMPPTPINSQIIVSQHSEEDEDDVPIAVQLAQVKQLVKSRFAPRSSPTIYDGLLQYPSPMEMRNPMSQASVNQDVVRMQGQHVSENFPCNSWICLWKK